MNPRIRGVLIAGGVLALIAGVGITVATSSTAADQRYVTTTAGTGEVTQTYLATGEVTRKYSADASFGISGTVKSVKVQAGDEVYAGDTLAVLDRGELRLAVLDATTSVAEAEASLYAARHPSSSGGGSTPSPSVSASPSPSASQSPSDTITIDPTVLVEASSRINLAVLDEATKCDPIFDLILPEPTASATPTATATATETATASPTATATATATSTESASSAAIEPSATASSLANVLDGDFTDEELQACADARAEVILANANLQQVVTDLTTPTEGTATPSPSSNSSSKSGGSSSSSSSTTTVSKAEVARAKASLLSAEQELASAQDDLSDATLVAPISGTVGEIGLSDGDSSSAGSITVEGAGNAVVTFELPLSTRQLVAKGQTVSVTPASSTEPLTGRITNISVLETSGTSGDSPTYTTTAVITDPEGLLASGSSETVTIPVSSVSSVVRLPASAVTLTGSGTGTVDTVDSASASSATTVEVKTGVIGGGWVQVTEGVEAGQLVVLADNTEEIPTNTDNRPGSSSSSSSASASATPSAAAPTDSAAPGGESAQPSATASR